MKKLKSYLLFFFVFVSVAAMMSSCDNDDIYSEYTPEEKPDSIKLPFVMDQNHDSVTVVVDGKTYTITYGKRLMLLLQRFLLWFQKESIRNMQ